MEVIGIRIEEIHQIKKVEYRNLQEVNLLDIQAQKAEALQADKTLR